MRHKVLDANVQAVRDLIKKYKAITQDQLGCDDSMIHARLHLLIGFGGTNECIVCRSVNAECNRCIHFVMAQSWDDHRCYMQGSYRRLSEATVSNAMVRIGDRINTLEDLLKRYQWDLDHDNISYTVPKYDETSKHCSTKPHNEDAV